MSQVLICDWCKKQIEDKDIEGELKLNEKKFDLCKKCSESIEKRLTSLIVPAIDKSPLDLPTKEAPRSRKEWIEQVEGDQIDPTTEVSVTDSPSASTRRTRTRATKEGVLSGKETNTDCPHYNKSQIVIPRDGSIPYQKCRDCGGMIEYSRKDLNDTLPKGCRFESKE